MRLLLTCVGLLALPVRPAAQAPPAQLAGLDRYIEQSLKDWGIPGAAIAVVRGDSVIYARGFGVRRLGDTARVTPETIFAIGSITKSFTVLALGLLADEDKLAWDDRAAERLPGFALADPWVTREVTIRDLVSHRTGLPGENVIFWGSALGRDEVVRRMRYLPFQSSLRTHYEYQNLGFIAAGQIIPAVAGKSWDDFVRERIFGPLGMTSSATRVADLSHWKNVASPHAPVAGRLQPIAWLNLDNGGPADSVTSTVLDMSKYLRFQMHNGMFGGRRLVSEAAIREMHAPQTIMPKESFYAALFPDAHFLSYGLGWMLHDYHGQLIVEHGGQTDGMHATLAMMPELDLGVVVLTNSVLFGYPAAIGYRVFDALLGRPTRDWSAEIQAKLRPMNSDGGGSGPPRVPGTTPTIPVEHLVGRYHHDYFGDADVTLRDGKLILSLLGHTAVLEHWHYDTYRPGWSVALVRGAAPLVSFERDGLGRVRALRFDRLGEFPKAVSGER